MSGTSPVFWDPPNLKDLEGIRGFQDILRASPLLASPVPCQDDMICKRFFKRALEVKIPRLEALRRLDCISATNMEGSPRKDIGLPKTEMIWFGPLDLTWFPDTTNSTPPVMLPMISVFVGCISKPFPVEFVQYHLHVQAGHRPDVM